MWDGRWEDALPDHVQYGRFVDFTQAIASEGHEGFAVRFAFPRGEDEDQPSWSAWLVYEFQLNWTAILPIGIYMPEINAKDPEGNHRIPDDFRTYPVFDYVWPEGVFRPL